MTSTPTNNAWGNACKWDDDFCYYLLTCCNHNNHKFVFGGSLIPFNLILVRLFLKIWHYSWHHRGGREGGREGVGTETRIFVISISLYQYYFGEFTSEVDDILSWWVVDQSTEVSMAYNTYPYHFLWDDITHMLLMFS